MNLKGSKTKENLMKSFAGESQARNRYNMAASLAKKEGLYIIETLFKYTAEQEKAHGKVFYDKLKEFTGETIDICGGYPIDTYDTTLQMLQSAQHNELEEYDVVYSSFAKVAKEEGFPDISNTFEKIASVEKVHGDRFGAYAKELQEGSLFKKQEDVQWLCTHCGYIHEGKEAPLVCPVCKHPQGYYILFPKSLFE